jgi:hypothetical protein
VEQEQPSGVPVEQEKLKQGLVEQEKLKQGGTHGQPEQGLQIEKQQRGGQVKELEEPRELEFNMKYE